jgi:outer membrane protein assembly factor BamB
MFRRYLFALALVPLAAAFARSAPAPADAAGSVAIPYGVATPDGKTGFLVGPNGGVEAVNLEDGKTLWTAKGAVRPLAATDKRLFAQGAVKDNKANGLTVLIYDVTQDGKRVLESEAVTFPDWVVVGGGPGRTWSADARLDKGNLLLKWQANSFYYGGAAPPPEIEKAARKSASGVAQVNLESGKVEALDADKFPSGPKLPKELEKVPNPLVVGDKVMSLAVEQAGQDQKLVRKAWDLASGKELEPVTLMQGKALSPLVGGDGKHVAVHQGLVKEQLPQGDYAWWVFDLETGKEVAKFPYEEQTTGISVVGPRAFYVVQSQKAGGFGGIINRTLKAVDLKSGKVVWDRPVESTLIMPPPP